MKPELRPPLVTIADREWAMAQMPPWCVRGNLSDACGELVDDGGWLDAKDPEDDQPVQHEFEDDEVIIQRPASPRKKYPPPNWSHFVVEQVEEFERHFAGQRKTYGDWSALWRTGWWPHIDVRKRFPHSAPKEFQPFFRTGSPEFDRALKVATKQERTMWARFGVAQFKPDDPRLSKVIAP